MSIEEQIHFVLNKEATQVEAEYHDIQALVQSHFTAFHPSVLLQPSPTSEVSPSTLVEIEQAILRSEETRTKRYADQILQLSAKRNHHERTSAGDTELQDHLAQLDAKIAQITAENEILTASYQEKDHQRNELRAQLQDFLATPRDQIQNQLQTKEDSLKKIASISTTASSLQGDLEHLQGMVAEWSTTAGQQFCQLRANLQRMDERKAKKQGHIMELYKKVLEERKTLWNQLQDLKGAAFRTCVRIRPNLTAESSSIAPSTVHESQITCTTPEGEKKRFVFDQVFGPQVSQHQVFEEVKSLTTSVMDGYYVSILGYGQSGSGKTHTIVGSAEHPGVAHLFLQEMIALANARDPQEYKHAIKVSLIEIQGDQVACLLAKTDDLPVVDHGPKKSESRWGSMETNLDTF